ncbi:phosphoglucosamine mutase [Desulfosudis oleivorans]|uniref:Phosphoglucosamine mutase n=1 Tax=Desulfosudis oleivorans (strain DSM 6200 / JCM 39069 / Hxd3) TaxID=96561 RepID=A8ZTE5_DESOH|nr:phosphoglucosamine mutase [Desulfosudis oleivorans]ABW67828.1 phosphoglucosamine mutase [Desulfosudis oleivorans Hxd3]
MTARLFGTDGIRGAANSWPMTPETAMAVGRAVARFMTADGQSPPRILVGKDTRLSGDMLESALCAGICASGVDAIRVDVLPTPAVAYLTAMLKAGAGIMVSASHNPWTDNGIKIFSHKGHKLSPVQEAELEALILSPEPMAAANPPVPGRVFHLMDAEEPYVECLSNITAVGSLSLVLDCANGAAARVAPRLFPDARLLSADPDGRNINENCGSEHTEALRAEVVKYRADAGFAFDGDADRLIAVDETGAPVTGDRIIAICAGFMKSENLLKNNTVVSTVMSNIGLNRALRDMGIYHVVTDVGDRHVTAAMLEKGASLGGEDSGHIVFSDYQTTGDGLLTALMLCRIMNHTGKPLSELAACMDVFPQVLINVKVARKPDLASVPEVWQVVRDVEARLGREGRVLVRYSGTQPMCRVMVEGPSEDETRQCAGQIAKAVVQALG